MSWLRLDDAMVGHRKTRRLLKGHRAGTGLASFGLHALALLHCAQYLTDGFVEQEFIDETFDDANVRGKQRAQLVQALVDGGQWEPCADGYMIHDYLQHNPSRAAVEAKRAKDAARKAAGRDAQSNGSPNGIRAESARTDAGRRAESDGPVPSRPTPVPSPTSEGESAEVEHLCILLADLIEGNGSKRPTIGKGWRTEARLLLERDGRSVEEAEAVIRWCQADGFWKTNVLSMPKLREKYDQLRLKMDERPGRPSNHVGAGPSGLEGEIRQWERWCAENGVTHPHGPQVAWRLSRHGDKTVTVEKVTAMLPRLTAAEEANAA